MSMNESNNHPPPSSSSSSSASPRLGITINTSSLSPLSPPFHGSIPHVVTSPRNDFFVSQRGVAAVGTTSGDYELNKIDTLSIEEQEILANIQELQLQLMKLRAEQDEDSDEETPNGNTGTPPNINSNHQLIVVSNNLPVMLEKVPQTGRWRAIKTTGGLDKLMCLTGVRDDLNFLWVGWVGQHIPKHEHESVRRLLLQHNCLPVFISSDVATKYHSFSSEVLWSHFHYVSEPVPLGGNSGISHPNVAHTGGLVGATKRFNKQEWRAYESANESFADAIAEIYNEGDSVWIHDYHLMLLPSLLRQRIPLCHIGWFLHTPFPSSDVYSRLPVRTQLLTGVLHADLVGFQTFDYERHFLSTCQKLLGVECSHKGIHNLFGSGGTPTRSNTSTLATTSGTIGVGTGGGEHGEHFTSIGVFPIGISVEPFAKAASSFTTLHRVNELRRKFGNKRIILGVDRLDNIKGIPHKLLAMEVLLNRFPEWQHNVVLVQIGVSVRSGPGEASSNSNSSTSSTATVTATASSSGQPPPPPTTITTTTATATTTTTTTIGEGTRNAAALTDTGRKNSLEKATATSGTGTVSSSSSSSSSTPRRPPPPSSNSSNMMDFQLEMSSLSYRNLLTQVNQLVGRINSAFGSLDYAPIHFLHQKTTQHEELCALYDLADVCLVTSTRDGMNLVAHEFVVCQQHFTRKKEERLRRHYASNSHTGSTSVSPATSPPLSSTKILTEWEGEEGGPGVLVLSEFAGCAQSLSGASVINPWNTEDVALSIHQALSMCRAEREIRQQKLYRYVSTNTATVWSMQFLNALGDAVAKNRENTSGIPKLDVSDVVQAYRDSKNRVILLDYDRTITPPQQAHPQNLLLPLAALGPNFKTLLNALSADERNTIFILSGRERKFLETWLNGVKVGVAAEDGFFYRMNLQNDKERWKTMSKFQYDPATRVAELAGLAQNGTSTKNDLDLRRRMSIQSFSSPVLSKAGSQRFGRTMTTTSTTSTASSRVLPRTTTTGTTTSSISMAGTMDEGDLFDEEDTSWKDLVLPTMLNFTDRTPGSYIEDKESCLTWHYGDADPQFGSWQARDLQLTLERHLIGTALDVYQFNQCVSVEHEGCTKAKLVESVLRFLSLPSQLEKRDEEEVDFVLCVCDDPTDEQMFQALETLVNESSERQKAAEEKALAETSAPTPPPPLRRRSNSLSSAATLTTNNQPTNNTSRRASVAGSSTSTRSNRSQQKRMDILRGMSENKCTSSDEQRRHSTSSHEEDDEEDEDSQEDEEDLMSSEEEDMEEDNKVVFSRLHKVPVRLAKDAKIYSVGVGADVQKGMGNTRHCGFSVDSLAQIRRVLNDFADTSRLFTLSDENVPATASTRVTKEPIGASVTSRTVGKPQQETSTSSSGVVSTVNLRLNLDETASILTPKST